MTETRSKQHLAVNRTPGISLRASRLGKRVDVRCERAVECSRQNYLAIDDALHGGLLSPLHGESKGVHYVGKAARLCRKNQASVAGGDIVSKER